MRELLEAALKETPTAFPNAATTELLNELKSSHPASIDSLVTAYSSLSPNFGGSNRRSGLMVILFKELKEDFQGRFMRELQLRNYELWRELMKDFDEAKLTQQQHPQQPHLQTPAGNLSQTASEMASPAKSTTRWIISRDERRRLVEMMEKSREDQKRKKKQNWYQKQDKLASFEGLWALTGCLNERDFQLIQLNESIYNNKIRAGLNEDAPATAPSEKRAHEGSISAAEVPDATRLRKRSKIQSYQGNLLIDFDSIEDHLSSLTRHSRTEVSEAAEFILNSATNLYESERLFARDLMRYDQPFFLYYERDDDGRSLSRHQWDKDALGAVKSSKSGGKFYSERAYRHRFLLSQPISYFFPATRLINSLKRHLSILSRASPELNFFINDLLANFRSGIMVVTEGPLLRAFALLSVLCVGAADQEIGDGRDSVLNALGRSLWSCKKFGVNWTITEIIKIFQEEVKKHPTTTQQPFYPPRVYTLFKDDSRHRALLLVTDERRLYRFT